MSSTPGHVQDHANIIELLPDYAVGALDAAQEDDVARHLETCPSCQRELREILQLVGLVSDAPLARPATREKLLARARDDTSRRSPSR